MLLGINRERPKMSSRAEACVHVITGVRAAVAVLAWVVLIAYTSVVWGQVQYAYDAAGRLTVVYAPNGDAAQYVYDAAGNITQVNRFTAATLSIIQFNPETGPVGTTVTIYGAGFNATPSANTVKFNGTVASISSGTTSQLVGTVPVGATTGPISVTNGGSTVTSSRNFTVAQPTAAPTISGFTPTIGTAGTAVTISGTNFDPQPIRDAVRFNATSAVVTTATTTTLSTSVPSGASSGKVRVATSLGIVTSSADFFVLPAPYTAASVGTTGRIVVDGSPLPVNITTPGKIALILFDGVAGQNIGLGISGVTVTPRGTDEVVLVFTPDGRGGLGFTHFTAGTSVDLSPLPVTGTYTIVIVTATTAQLSAILTLSSDLTGTLGGEGSTATFNTARVGQNGRYTFGGIAGNAMGVSITNSSIASTTAEMLKPDGSVLASASIGAYGGQIPLQTLPVTGTYTVFVSPVADNTGRLDLQLGVPDLTVSGATLGAISIDQNGAYSIPVTFTVTNVGSASAAPSWYDAGYLSNDATLDDNDPPLALSSHGTALPPNGSYVVNVTYNTPSTITAGAYTLFLKADGHVPGNGRNTDAGSIAESDETNNTNALTITLGGKPDLTASGGTVGTITLNQNGSYTFPVTFTVNNIGPLSAQPPWYDVAYLSNDPTLDDNDVVLGYTLHSTALAANGSYVVNATSTTPTTTAAGNYTLFLKADGRGGDLCCKNTDTGNVTEANEANNTQALTITLPGKPDLKVSGGTIGPITVSEAGAYSFPVTFTVTNIGGSTALPLWYDMGYLSSNATLHDGDLLVGVTNHTTALAPNGSYVVNETYGTGTGIGPGTYTLFLKADGRAQPFWGGTNTDSGNVVEANEANNIQALSIALPGLPDLTVTSLGVGAFTVNRNGSYTFPVTYTVKNVSGTPASADGDGWWDMGYLSVDGTLDVGDVKVSGVAPHGTALAAGASYTTTAPYTTPPMTPGPYTLFVKANGSQFGSSTDQGLLAEANVANNTKALAVTLPTRPDLTVTSASVGAITVNHDGTYSFQLTYTVKNVGLTAAQPDWSDMVYLSTDGVFDESDTAYQSLAERSTALGAGVSYTATSSIITMAAAAGPRTYTLFVKTDAEFPSLGGTNTGPGYLAEANEANNVRAVTLTLPVKPDLKVTSASVGAITVIGSNYNVPVTFTVTNVGGATAQPSWSDWAYISRDGTLDSGVPLSAVNSTNVHVTALAAGASYTKTVTYTAPTTTAPGGYTLFIKADGDSAPTGSGVLVEANEGNNTQALPFTLPALKPDLTVSSLTVGTPITVAQNGAYSFPVTYKVTNAGVATAAPSWYDVGYLSSDGTLDTAAVLTGYRQRTTALAPAAIYTITATFTTDATTLPRNYTLFLKADGQGGALGGSNTDSGKLAEADETNNVRSVTLTLPNKPDLTVSIVTVGAIVKNTNGSYKIPVTYKVTNSGGAAAQPSWYDVAYLSDDATLHDTDAALAGYHTQIAALAVNGSYTVIGTFTTSTTTPAGTHTLFVKADGRSAALGGTNTDAGKVTEANETNNSASVSVVLP